jgi:Na+/H+ antiporter NhaA
VIARQLAEIARARDSEVEEGTMWEVSRVAREAVSPLARMERQLHPWSAYVVLPVFALANAGVELSADALGAGIIGVSALLLRHRLLRARES